MADLSKPAQKVYNFGEDFQKLYAKTQEILQNTGLMLDNPKSLSYTALEEFTKEIGNMTSSKDIKNINIIAQKQGVSLTRIPSEATKSPGLVQKQTPALEANSNLDIQQKPKSELEKTVAQDEHTALAKSIIVQDIVQEPVANAKPIAPAQLKPQNQSQVSEAEVSREFSKLTLEEEKQQKVEQVELDPGPEATAPSKVVDLTQDPISDNESSPFAEEIRQFDAKPQSAFKNEAQAEAAPQEKSQQEELQQGVESEIFNVDTQMALEKYGAAMLNYFNQKAAMEQNSLAQKSAGGRKEEEKASAIISTEENSLGPSAPFGGTMYLSRQVDNEQSFAAEAA